MIDEDRRVVRGADPELDAEPLAAIDADSEAELPTTRTTSPSRSRGHRHPDPFGMDWKWAEPEDAPSVISFSAQPKRSFRLRSVGYYGIGAAVAASLLIGVLLGGLVFRGGGLRPSTGGMDVLLASVTPKFGTLRGSEHSLLVEVASVRPGFATIITLAPDRPQQVFPEPGEEPDPRRSIGTANLRPPAPRLDHRACADHRDARD